MNALCAVTTSFCHFLFLQEQIKDIIIIQGTPHSAIVSFGSSLFQLLPISSCAFLHSVHSAVFLLPYFTNVPVLPGATFSVVAMVWTCF
jgi:hypothetical protein